MSTWLALFVVALGAILLISDQYSAIADVDQAQFAYLVAGLAVVIFLTGGMRSRYDGRAGAMLRDLLSWIGGRPAPPVP